MRLEPRPRLVDWAILGTLVTVLVTGVGTLFAGDPADWWIVGLHGAAGLLLAVPVYWKLRRERRHLDPRRWTPRTASSVLLSGLVVAAMATGLAWALGAEFGVLAWTGLVVHAGLGLLLVPVVVFHLRGRFRLPERADFDGRRTALQAGLLVAGGIVAWRGQRAVTRALAATDDVRRFTGSRRADGEGNDFPVTSWVADDPDPVAPDAWSLQVHGAVHESQTFSLADLDTGDERAAVLDCTSGWYADRRWQGVRVGTVLDAVEPDEAAAWVSFRSVTGYRFSLPLAEARDALLATRVDGDVLNHGHGFPLRLVAPGRRGYQWVKWIQAVEVRATPDYGQWGAIFTSGFR